MSQPARKPDDIAYVHCTTTFDWLERLRILFGRPLNTRTAVSVWFPEEGRPLMHAESDVSSLVPPIFPRREPPMHAPIDGAATARVQIADEVHLGTQEEWDLHRGDADAPESFPDVPPTGWIPPWRDPRFADRGLRPPLRPVS